jgi:shikimate kinase
MGEEYFRFKEKEVLRALVEDHKDFIISCGGGTPCFFNNIDFMKEKGKVIWLNTGIRSFSETIIERKTPATYY